MLARSKDKAEERPGRLCNRQCMALVSSQDTSVGWQYSWYVCALNPYCRPSQWTPLQRHPSALSRQCTCGSLSSLQEPGPLQMSGVYCDCVTYGPNSRHLNLLSRSSVSHVIRFITQITGNNMFRIFTQRRTPLQLPRSEPGTGNEPFHN